MATGYYLRSLDPTGKYLKVMRGNAHFRVATDGEAEPQPDFFLDHIRDQLNLKRLHVVDRTGDYVIGIGHGFFEGRRFEASIGWFAKANGNLAKRLPIPIESELCYISGCIAYGVIRPHTNMPSIAGFNTEWRGCRWIFDPQLDSSRASQLATMESSQWFWSIPLRPYNGGQLCLVHGAVLHLQPALAVWDGEGFEVEEMLPSGFVAHCAGQHSCGTTLFVLNSDGRGASSSQQFCLWRPGKKLELFHAPQISGLPACEINFLHLAGEHLVLSTTGKDGVELFLLED